MLENSDNDYNLAIPILERIEILNDYVLGDDDPHHVSQLTYPRSGTNWLSSILYHVFGLDTYFVTRAIMTDEVWAESRLLVSHPYPSLKYSDKMKHIISIRDPRDVVRSRAYFHVLTKPNLSVNPKQDREWIEHYARTWTDHFDLGMMDCPHIVIQYERLCLYPVAEMERIREFTGLEYAVHPRDVNLRFDRKDGVIEPDFKYYNEHCNKWQTDADLHKDWNDIILSVCGERMEQFGYLPNAHSWKVLYGFQV